MLFLVSAVANPRPELEGRSRDDEFPPHEGYSDGVQNRADDVGVEKGLRQLFVQDDSVRFLLSLSLSLHSLLYSPYLFIYLSYLSIFLPPRVFNNISFSRTLLSSRRRFA